MQDSAVRLYASVNKIAALYVFVSSMCVFEVCTYIYVYQLNLQVCSLHQGTIVKPQSGNDNN